MSQITRPDIDLVQPFGVYASRGGALAGRADGNRGDVTGYTAQFVVTGASQVMLPVDPRRKFLFIQNNDTLGSCNIAFGVDATLQTGIKLSPGGGGILLDNNVPTSALSIIGSTPLNTNITFIVG